MVNRRSWSFNEERVLVNALKELVAHGQKCDNGFKSGYLNLLEAKLLQEIPGTDLRGEPHINSKIHVWKKLYGLLREILGNNGSGAGLDGRYMVDVTDDKWEALIKRDKSFKKIRNKSFPFYVDWIEIFGKDRANGDNAQTAADVLQEAVNNIHMRDTPPVRVNPEPPSPPLSLMLHRHSNPPNQNSNMHRGQNAVAHQIPRKHAQMRPPIMIHKTYPDNSTQECSLIMDFVCGLIVTNPRYAKHP